MLLTPPPPPQTQALVPLQPPPFSTSFISPPPPPPPPPGKASVLSCARSALGGGPLRVQATPPLEHFHYLRPGAASLVPFEGGAAAPPTPAGCVRVVCIADTHNEHESLRLPAGDVLVHAGDCLTESGRRHVERRANKTIVRVLPEGEVLFARFAAWLGRQPHAHKVLIGGNHDLVLQGLGRARVQQILDEHASCGVPPVYLEHSAADLPCGSGAQPLRVFGSPYAHWGGHNDAFFAEAGADFSAVPTRCNVVVTHMPCVLPRGGGAYDEDENLGRALRRSGSSLHVSGHCHWAHGAYASHEAGGVPCVVASVCDSHWLGPHELTAASGTRGDAKDARRGGYNVELAPIVCDLRLPGQT